MARVTGSENAGQENEQFQEAQTWKNRLRQAK